MPHRRPTAPPRVRAAAPPPPADTGDAAAAAAAAPPAAVDADAVDRWESLRERLDGRPGGDALPAPMLDGYLCGVLLQPRAVPVSRWWPPAIDPDEAARTPPAGAEVDDLRRLAEARHAELDAAIRTRRWFDPWVIAPQADADDADPVDAETGEVLDDDEMPGMMPAAVRDAVYPWVAGFAHAMACFADLLELADPAAAEPQALICQFLDPDDLEDADALLALIETLEPPADLDEAVEQLVRATLLLADLTRPAAAAPTVARTRRGASQTPGGRGRPRRPRGAGGRPPHRR